MTADDKKEKVRQAKTALAIMASVLIDKKIQEDSIDTLSLSEKKMISSAKDSGLLDNSIALFRDSGYRGMYNMGIKELSLRKGVDSKRTLYDFMGMTELAGNLRTWR